MTDVPMMKPIPAAKEIPNSFGASVKGWVAAGGKNSQVSEERLLRMLPFFQSETWPRANDELSVVGTSSQVTLSTPKRFLNMFSITPTNTSSSPNKTPVVMLHGFGAGLGFYFRNYPALARWVAETNTPIHSLDWLGMGRSARVPFVVKAKRDDVQGRVSQAEGFFLDALEEWRIKQGLERMTLVGHSLGAYLAAAYALKHPERVTKLVLLSPAGVLGEPESEQPSRELTDDQRSLTAHDAREEVDDRRTVEMKIRAAHTEQREKKEKEPMMRRVFTHLWEEGWSPFQLIRNLTVFGPWLVGKYSSRRFSGLTEEETRNIHDYILNITLAKGSGEYCISHILAPFAHARMPLVDRVSALKIPVTFVYGEHDWMDPLGGLKSVEKLKEAGNHSGKMVVVPNAGHHVYLDNSEYVNNLLLNELSFE